MGNVIPDRLFWAQPAEGAEFDTDEAELESSNFDPSFQLPPHDTQH
jgi:hypothetical protein